MTSESSADDILGPLLDEFLARKRRGEMPALTEFVSRHPELEDEIRELFPTVAMMEQVETAAPQEPRITRDGRSLQRLGDYRIIREVGRGGMGIVYEAIQESLGRHVAIKVLPWQSVSDERLVKRFQREARISAALHHTNIVPVYGVGEADGVHFLAMQFIRGQSLDSVLDELRRLPEDGQRAAADPPEAGHDDRPSRPGSERDRAAARSESQQIAAVLTGSVTAHPKQQDVATVVEPRSAPPPSLAADTSPPQQSATVTISATGTRGSVFYRRAARMIASVADAIDYAHSHGVVHRDIKPANLMIDLEGEVWVTDFGLARAGETSLTTESSADAALACEDLTHTGDLVGTVRYLAPERFDGRNDARSDIYSLGLTLHEFVTLRPAFTAPDRLSLIQLITTGPPPSPRRFAPDLPRDLETIIAKATQHDPAQRYASAAEMAVDLRRFLDGKPIVARRTSVRERFVLWCRRRPTVAVLSGLVLTLVVTLAIGSSIAAFQLNRSLGNVQEARRAEGVANRNARRSLFDAYMAQARAEVSGISSGRHFATLAAVDRAADLAAQVSITTEDRLSLRNAAIHGLVLDDLKRDIHSSREQPNTFHQKFGFDAAVTRIAVIDDDGSLQVRSLEDESVVHRIPGRWQMMPMAYTRISADDRYVAVHGTLPNSRCAVSLWDTRTESFLLEEVETGLREWVRCFAFSPDALQFVYAVSSEVRIVELPTMNTVRVWQSPGQTQHAGFSRDGRLVVADAGRGAVVVLATDGSDKELRIAVPGRATDADFSPDGRLLATSCDNNIVYVWDINRPQSPLVTMKGHTSSARSVEFSPDGLLLASTGWDTTSRLWQPSIGRELCRVSGQVSAFSRDGGWLGFEGAAQGYGRFQTNRRDVCRSIVEIDRDTDIDDMQFHPDGHLLAFANDEGVFLYRWPDAALIRRWDPLDEYTRCRFLDQGRRLLVAGGGGVECFTTADLLQETPGAPVARFQAASSAAHDCAVATEEESVIFVNAGERLHRLDGTTLTEVGAPLPLPAEHTFLSTDPQGRFVASSGKHSRTVAILDGHSGRELHRYVEQKSPGIWTRFSGDGRVLALSLLGRVEFLSTQDWQTLGEFDLGEMSIGRVAFAPDGTTVAVQSRSRVTLLRADSFQVVAEFTPRFGEPLCSVGPEMAAALEFSADSACLAVGTRENSIHAWDLGAIHRYLSEQGLAWQQTPLPLAWSAAAAVDDSVATSQTAAGPRHSARAAAAFEFPESSADRRQRKLAELNARVASAGDDPRPLAERSFFYRDAGQLDLAIADWSLLIERLPEQLSWRFYRGRAYQDLQPPDLVAAAAD